MVTQALTPREIQKIATDNLGLVRKIAWKFSIPADAPFTIDDLIAEGTIGLMKMIPKFDASLGFAFSSYASPHIRGEIQHFLARRVPTIRNRQGGPKIVLQSLDEPIYGNSEETFLDTIAYNEPPEEDWRKSKLDEIMHKLPKIYRDILLMQQQGLSLQKIAIRQGVSYITIRRRASEARQHVRKIVCDGSAN